MTTPRAELRKTYLAARERLPDDERIAAEQTIADHIVQHARVMTATTVAAFMATRGEVSLQTWFAKVPETLQLALPVVAGNRGEMSFHAFDPHQAERLIANRYGILEPPEDAPLVTNFEVMLTPLVAYDAHGNRLGMGGGYYDRYLASATPKPYLLGVAFACQQADALPAEEWDMRLDAVVTENGVLEFS